MQNYSYMCVQMSNHSEALILHSISIISPNVEFDANLHVNDCVVMEIIDWLGIKNWQSWEPCQPVGQITFTATEQSTKRTKLVGCIKVIDHVCKKCC